jgi:cytosine permease
MNWLSDLLQRVEAVAPSHSMVPVPASESVPAYRVAMVCTSVAFTLTGLYMGSEIASEIGWRRGVLASVVGSLILVVMSIPASVVGARTRLSTYMIVRFVFGPVGSRLINAVLAAVLIGWFAVTAEFFGRTCYLTVQQYFPHAPVPLQIYTLVCCLLVIATTVFGFRALDRISLCVAPLLVALTIYVAHRALGHASWSLISANTGTDPDLGRGISAVVGGMIVNVVLMPDLTRYSRTVTDCVVISVTGNGVANGVMLILAMIPALAFGEQDPMRYMALIGLVPLAFTILVLSTWSVNAVNLYSSGLVTATALPSHRYSVAVIGSGLVGTVLALLGLADRFLDFLVLLGLIVPPIAAVYLADYFVLGRTDYATGPAGTVAAKTNLNGLAAATLGAVTGCGLYVAKVSFTGVPTIEAFVVAAVAYWGLEKIRVARGRNRLWRAMEGLGSVVE